MAKITTVIQPFTKTPNRQNPATFSEDMDTRLAEENSRINQMNNFSSEANYLAEDLTQKNLQASTSATNATNAAAQAEQAKNEATNARDEIESYVIPQDATYTYADIDAKDNIILEAAFNAYGYTKELKKSERFEETNTPYIVQDKGGDTIRFSKGLVKRNNAENIHLPLAPFADGSTDELLSHSDNGFETQMDHKAGNIIHCGDGDGIEQTYQAITDTTSGDLVTDDTKFSKIDFVSRQDVIFIGEDGKYKTIKGYHNFQDGSDIDAIANAYGFAKIDENLYSVTNLEVVGNDGNSETYTGEAIIIGLVRRLNNACYNPMHNVFGTRGVRREGESETSDYIEYWNSDLAMSTDTTYKCITNISGNADHIGSVATESTNPYRTDSRFYDKVYLDGNVGVLDFKSAYAIKTAEKKTLEQNKDIVKAKFPFNGYAGDKIDMRFETSENNILKVANPQEQYIVDGKVAKPNETIDLDTTNDRTGFNGEGDNSFVPHVHVVGFDPISTGSITGSDVAADAQIGSILDNVPAQTANTRIKCRVKPTTDGIKVEILDKSDSDAVVRTQTIDGTDAETLTFTLPVNDDGYKVKATKITNDGSGDEDIQVTAEVSTGLTVDGKMKRGDYVVLDREELVTNGTFDNDTNGWVEERNVSISVDEGKLKLVTSTDDYGYAYGASIPLTIGCKYILKADYISGTDAQVRLATSKNGTNIVNLTSEGSATFVATTTSCVPHLYSMSTADNNTVYADGISVKLANDTFKAIEDTDDGESLASSKFKPQDWISNQVFVGMKDDGSYTYDVLTNDAYAKDSATKILTNNGYSSLGKGLFSKGNDVVTPMGYIQTLNKGAYHPMLNPMGTRGEFYELGNSGSTHWFNNVNGSRNIFLENTADLFMLGSTGSEYEKVRIESGRILESRVYHPQGKFYDIVYPSQFRDLRYSADVISYHDTASKEFSDGVGGKGGVCDTLGLTRLPTEPYKQQHEYIEDGTLVYLPITQVGEQFCIDVLGSPENYSTVMKDRLAEENTIVGINPLLVGQDGTDYATSNDIDEILSQKAIGLGFLLRQDIETKTYNSYPNRYINNITNTSSFESQDDNIYIIFYAASIPVAPIQDPKAVEYVLEKYIASNNNEIALGNNITSLINVGTGTGKPETNAIGNTIIDKDGLIVTEPNHKTITLDNTGDKAAKAFLTIASDSDGELYAQWFVEELVKDADSGSFDGDNGEFGQLTNGIATDLNGNTCRTVVASRPLNMLKEI